MNVSEVKQNILHLSVSIARRSEIIEKQSGERNLLEIDLAMEDIRFLYREMERMKLLISQDYMPSSSSAQVIEKKSPLETPPTRTSMGNDFDNQKKTSDSDSYEEQNDFQVKEQKPVDHARQTSDPVSQPTNEPPTEIRSKPEQEQNPVKKDSEPVNQNETVYANSKTEIESTEETRTVGSQKENKTNDPVKPSLQKSENHTTVKSLGETISNKKTVVADKLGGSSNSIYERLSKIKEDHSIGAKMQQKPVTNIKSAIGINEKFLFINELFNGDIKSYNDAVDKLNNFSSIHEAFEYLNLLTDTFQWDGNRSSETIEKFANLVQRRFM